MSHLVADLSVAEQFGCRIVGGDYVAACALLAHEARLANPPQAIEAAVARMLSGAPGPILQSQMIEEGTVMDWPGQQPADIAVVYVALSGDGFSEAVTLTLVLEAQQVRIRQLVWGRP
jgi:hypothetical protein